MARPWRLRHKLALGLGLVLASIALILGGAFFGLSSSVETMHVSQRRIDEMVVVAQLRDHIHNLTVASAADADTEQARIGTELLRARAVLTAYRETLATNAAERPDGIESEQDLAAAIERGLGQFEAAVQSATGAGIDSEPSRRLTDQAKVADTLKKLNLDATALFQTPGDSVKRAFERTHSNHRRGLTVAGAATVMALLLVVTLLHYFRVWIFAPIRMIQAGVQRVQAGDFAQPIRLASPDEFGELAEQFNGMAAQIGREQADLNEQVEARSRQLVAAEKMVSVGFLAAGVAHEINNPMASIQLCAESLQSRIAPILPHAGLEGQVISRYLDMIEQEAFRCKQITERLLDYSRTGSGQWQSTDLGQLVQNVLALVEHLPAKRGKALLFLADDGPVVATVNATELQGLVNNLVVNALEATGDGGTVQVALRSTGDAAELLVRDTGCGMGPDVLPHIFEPFYTRSQTGKGTGLGLFISQKIAAEHGGGIRASSDGPGHGSAFTVRLPLRRADTPPPATLPFPGARTAAAA